MDRLLHYRVIFGKDNAVVGFKSLRQVKRFTKAFPSVTIERVTDRKAKEVDKMIFKIIEWIAKDELKKRSKVIK